MFTKDDVAEYYNTTQSHYKTWWKLEKNLSLHYGLWEKGTNNFQEALINTNKVLMELADIKASDVILDAGCGVGGAALYINANTSAKVTGITLSEKQLKLARHTARVKKQDDKVQFHLMDYTDTTFPDESFDVVWACESHISVPDNELFLKETHRLLKKGGRLILCDYFLPDNPKSDNDNLIAKWLHNWSMEGIVSNKEFINNANTIGFTLSKNLNYTHNIYPSAKRMYYAYLGGALPSILYNFLHSKSVSRFAKTHYLSGKYQYLSLKKGLWQYNVILAVK
jgi:tocopherol O-methyltransferase